MVIRIVASDDDPIFLAGLEAVLRKEKDFEILACYATGEETLSALRKLRPDVVLLDPHLTPGGGAST